MAAEESRPARNDWRAGKFHDPAQELGRILMRGGWAKIIDYLNKGLRVN